MITIGNIDKFNNTLAIYALSTDVKPLETIKFKGVDYRVTNASTFYEIDTKKTTMFDEENRIWYDVQGVDYGRIGYFNIGCGEELF